MRPAISRALRQRHTSRRPPLVPLKVLPAYRLHGLTLPSTPYIGEPTLADAILDRLVHNAYKINLKGESMRKNNPHLTINTNNE